MNFATSTPTGVSLARLPDTNKTVVAPFTPAHAKYKLERVFLPSSVKSGPPTCTHMDPASSHKASASPVVADIFGVDPLTDVYAGATSVARFEGGDDVTRSLPTSTRGSLFRNHSPSTVVSPLSIIPSGGPDMLLPTSPPVYKSSYRQIHLTSGNHLSTTPRIHTAVSRPVEPSGVPDRSVAPEPRAESSAQAELRRIFQRCLEDSPQRQRYSKPLPATPSVASKPRSESVSQAEVQRKFQPCFNDSRLQHTYSKSTTPVRILTDAEENHIGALQTNFGQERSERDRLLSSRSHISADPDSPRLPTRATPKKDITTAQCNSEGIQNYIIRDGAENQPRLVTSVSERDAIAADPSQMEVRGVGRSRRQSRIEAAAETGVSVCTKYHLSGKIPEDISFAESRIRDETVAAEPRESQSDEQPRQQIRQEDLFAHVQPTPKRYDERHESRAKGSQEVDIEVPSTALSTPTSEHRPLTMSGEWDHVARLHSLLELIVSLPDEKSASTIEQTSWSFEGYVRQAEPVEPSWGMEDHIPVTDDESVSGIDYFEYVRVLTLLSSGRLR
jgi:hypothetical protein